MTSHTHLGIGVSSMYHKLEELAILKSESGEGDETRSPADNGAALS